MCFEIHQKKQPVPTKASEDIIVYKAIRKDGGGVYNQMIIGGKKTLWKKGNEYYETTPFKSMTKSRHYDRWDIHGDAFHSGITYDDGKLHTDTVRKDIVVKMIIPKGALYFKNHKEYVSSRLVYPRYKI